MGRRDEAGLVDIQRAVETAKEQSKMPFDYEEAGS
jgi:hypothetical protein